MNILVLIYVENFCFCLGESLCINRQTTSSVAAVQNKEFRKQWKEASQATDVLHCRSQVVQ